MKKQIATVLAGLAALSLLSGCGAARESKGKKVGLVTDSGTIDDKSFNQGAWEGIRRGAADFKLDAKYLKPETKSTADYLISISNLVDGGYGLVVTTGFMFQEAIAKAQLSYPQTRFILVDATVPDLKPNVTAVLFAEEEAGFLAGIAAALESVSGKVGFIGGMEIPPVQKFGWGFAAGVAYAGKTFGSKAEIAEYLYEGSFDNVQGGTALAAGMFDKGIDVIFTAAGGVGGGAINEAKARRIEGKKVYIVGVDVDQYESGKVPDGASVILTSALKRVDNAVYSLIKGYAEGTMEGGKTIVFDVKSGGVGLPDQNPNLSAETVQRIAAVTEDLKTSRIDVPDSIDGLKSFLAAYQYAGKNLKF